MSSSKLLAIVGPTAVGKSDLALTLAKSFDVEIVSADSRQIYRHMDIGTAKPTVQERTQVPHHLIDAADPDERYSLALFLDHATEAIQGIQSRSMLPMLVGGSGQYVWGLLEGWQVPEVPPDPAIREDLERRSEQDGVEVLFRELEQLDPEAAGRVDPRNPRRVIRALEVIHSAGRESNSPRKQPPPYEIKVIGLTMDRKALYQRIDSLVDIMIKAGWVEEVRHLLDMGYGPDLPSMSSFGYGELALHLSGGMTLDSAVQRIKYNTHRFARQQYAWFRLGDERISWFDASEGHEPILEEVSGWLESGRGVLK